MAERARICLLLALWATAVACGEDREESSKSTDVDQRSAVTVRSEDGPVELIASLSPKSARLSDELDFVITVRTEPGVEVEPPVFGESHGDFQVLDFHRPLPREVDGKTERRFEFRLEPMETGTLTVYPVPMMMIDRRGDEEEMRLVETEGLEIEIASVLADAGPSLADAKPDTPPIAPPEPERLWWPWIVTGAAALVLIAGLIVYLVRRPAPPPPEIRRTPRELAYLEIEALIQSNLASKDIKLFYVELTAIVRRFIERTHGVHAPEQTTEEFLAAIAAHPDFLDEERRRLQAFLESADLVKFAAFQPRDEDIESSFERAKAFVGFEEVGST
ncbi:MAG: hypothetical protein RL885_32720 [Planctomycetota bacterium]